MTRSAGASSELRATSRPAPLPFSCLLALASALAVGGCAPAPPDAAVVVEHVAADGAGARAGLQAGDRLLSFSRGPAPPANPDGAQGTLSSCLELALLEVEQAPRGPVELEVWRDRRRRTVRMPPGEWKLSVLPAPTGAADRPVWEALARGRRAAEARDWPAAQSGFEAALAAARPLGAPLLEALVRQEQGLAYGAQPDLARAAQALEEALSRRRQAAPGSLSEAASLHALGRLERIRGNLDLAEQHLGGALALWDRQAPVSLERAWTLNNLGTVALFRERLADAQARFEEALALTHRLAPESLYESQPLNNLGALAKRRGEPAEAEAYFRRSADMLQRVSPKHEDLARTLVNVSQAASDRGDLAASDEALRQALAVYDSPLPETTAVAAVFERLAGNARDRGDLEGALRFFQRSLDLERRVVPGSLGEASTLSQMCFVAMKADRLDEAERWGQEALAIQERRAPGSHYLAGSLQGLGMTAMKRGEHATADRHLERALALSRQLGRGTLREAIALQNLGHASFRAERWAKAERCLEEGLALLRRVAPGTTRQAQSWASLGQLYERLGRDREAEAALTTAIETFEQQIGRLGGADEARTSYLDSYLPFYHLLMDLQARRGDREQALRTLERSRGRSLLIELASRELAFAADLPAELRERRRRLEREYERAQAALSAAVPGTSLEALAQLRAERGLLAQEIADASPRYDSLTNPRILSLAEIRAVLDPGTAWLSFSLAAEEGLLFVVRPESPEVGLFRLAIGRDRAAQEVAVFRGLILDGRRDAGATAAVLAQAARLYDLLLAPAEAAFGPARRLLVSPDGPLHALPFAALARAGDPPRFLVEDRPIHLVLSATLYAELRRGRASAPRSDGRLVAFGDPLYGAASAPGDSAGETGSVLASGADEGPTRRYQRGLAAIAGTRDEVEALARLYRGESQAFLGADATEKAVKRLAASPRYLHFACHALLDPRIPLDSALALSIPRPGDEENGLLQAWEIFEQLRLDADLVTLSACDTALGKDAAGEGLIGLTRAFQYAGARSVIAALWPVSDRSTAELMARFYAALARGRPKDEALAEAQRSFARGEGVDAALRHPFHWAAFELNGDGR